MGLTCTPHAPRGSPSRIQDYNTLLTVLPDDAPQRVEVKRALALLKPRIEAAQKAETAEMLDKLKGLGNSLLGMLALTALRLRAAD